MVGLTAAIGRLEAHPSILQVVGHQQLGLTRTAITVELMEALALARPTPDGLRALRIERLR